MLNPGSGLRLRKDQAPVAMLKGLGFRVKCAAKSDPPKCNEQSDPGSTPSSYPESLLYLGRLYINPFTLNPFALNRKP